MPGSSVVARAVASANVRTSGQKVLTGRGRDASVKSKNVSVWRTHTWCTFSSAAVSRRVTCRPPTAARTVAVAAAAPEAAYAAIDGAFDRAAAKRRRPCSGVGNGVRPLRRFCLVVESYTHCSRSGGYSTRSPRSIRSAAMCAVCRCRCRAVQSATSYAPRPLSALAAVSQAVSSSLSAIDTASIRPQLAGRLTCPADR